MDDLQFEGLRLAAARADFLDGGDAAGVPAMVAASWRRSRGAGVAAESYAVPYSDDVDVDSRLARCARPVLRRLEQDMCEVPVTIALADARARIVDRRDCSSAVGRVLDRVDFNPGFGFAEGGVGTNGIGTVFEAGQSVSVVGPAHFNEALTPFACTGAPVIDPVTGRMEGVLDVSLLASSWNPLIHAMVRSAAADIGRNLMLDRDGAQQALVEAYLRVDARSRHAVMAVGDTVIVNSRAQRLLTPEEQALVQSHARFLFARPSMTADRIERPDGRPLHLRLLRVAAGADTSGMVVVISELPHGAARVATRSVPAGTAAPDALPAHIPAPFEPTVERSSRTPAWNRARTELVQAVRAGQPTLVQGEPGTGRLTLVSEVFATLHPDGRETVIEPHRAGSGSADDLSPGPTLIVVRDLDRVEQPAVVALGGLLARLSGRPGVQLTATTGATLPADHPAAGLVRHFTTSVLVPSLKHRREDLPAIADGMLTELAPERRLRISPQAHRLLQGYTWPGNLPQLREAVAHAIARRPVGELQVEDLPGYCRSGNARSLSGIEAAERDAIVAALEAHQGNRLQSAQALGMSRSSLYRKLRSYGLTDL